MGYRQGWIRLQHQLIHIKARSGDGWAMLGYSLDQYRAGTVGRLDQSRLNYLLVDVKMT